MGGHYGTIHVRTEDRDAVRSAIERLANDRTRRFLIAPAIDGWVTVFPEHNGQEAAVSEALAAKLSDKILIHCLVHDDDVFAYWVFEAGRIVDTYNSCPDYFGEPNPPPRGGKAEALKHLLLDPTKVSELQALLDAARFDFELERQDQFAALLGLPNSAYAYEYLQGGERDGVQRWKDFIHIPDLAPEKAGRRAAAAQERAEVKRLQRERVLFVNEVGEKGRNKHFPKTPLWAVEPATSGVVLTWQDYAYGEMSPPEWRRFSPPDWSAKKWEAGEMGRATGFQFSPAGSWLVTQSQDRSQIDVWDCRNQRGMLKKRFAGTVTAMSFTADENWLFVVVHNQAPLTQLHRLALKPGLEDAVLTDEILHFQSIAPHPGGQLLAVVDNFGVLLALDLQSMGVINQVWIKETHPVLPENLREGIISNAIERFEGVLKNHLSTAELEQHRQRSARHFLPKDSIFTCCFSSDGKSLFCGTHHGLCCLDWTKVLRGPEMQAVPVQLFVEEEPAASEEERGAAFAHRLVYSIAFDAEQNRVLFSGLEGKITYIELDDARSGTLLEVPGRVPLIHLGLSPDRSALVATGHRRVAKSNKSESPCFQIWNYAALCQAAGVPH
jgi:hypothetical protein